MLQRLGDVGHLEYLFHNFVESICKRVLFSLNLGLQGHFLDEVIYELHNLRVVVLRFLQLKLHFTKLKHIVDVVLHVIDRLYFSS